MAQGLILLLTVLLKSTVSMRINFTNCLDPSWTCINCMPNEIIYNCDSVKSDNFTFHLKDYYVDHITSVTVQNCKNLKVVIDCPLLQKTSQLQHFKVKDCDRLEFISLSINSLLQTPPEVEIEGVKEVVSLPRGLFKSPTTLTQLKCLGTSALKKIRIAGSIINTVNTGAIYNVTGIKSIEFDNVTIKDIKTEAIEAIMGSESVFKITNTNINLLALKSIVVHSTAVTITENTFNDIITGSVNFSADHIYITGNKIKQIDAYGFDIKSINIDITQNTVNTIKSNAFSSVKCLRNKSNKKVFNFSRNIIANIEPYSVAFDYTSCKSAGTVISFDNNKMDCKCQHIAFLNTAVTNTELYNIILDASNNNTCVSTPCMLPVDVVKMLLESDMCELTLDPQIICLLYSDKHSNNSEVTTDEDVTEAAPTFYLIRLANSVGDASAALTAVDKDNLLKDGHLNMANRTAIKVVFDASRGFVETVRSASTSRKKPEEPKPPQKEDYVSRCVGEQCRINVAYDRQKALDFYKYVYAQLRPPKLKS